MSVQKKVVKSAVAVIPPLSVWDPIQEIRREHDKSFVRWMPHINMLYPFARDSEFATLKPKAIEALQEIQPFEITFSEFSYFQHGKKSSTLWLNPQENGAASSSLKRLETQLLKAFPQCDDLAKRGNGFVPHLTVGQFKGQPQVEQYQAKFQGTWKPLTFTVNCLYFISRTDTDPFEVRAIIPLAGASVADTSSCFDEKPVTTHQLPNDQFQLFVGGLSTAITVEQLKNFFSTECDVIKVVLPVDAKTKQKRGFGFVTGSNASAPSVISALHNKTLDGRKISVRVAN